MIEAVLFSRENCHLCDDAINDLNSLQNELPHSQKIIDIDKDLELKSSMEVWCRWLKLDRPAWYLLSVNKIYERH